MTVQTPTYALALDIGGTKIAAACVEFPLTPANTGEVVLKHYEVPTPKTSEAFIDAMATALEAVRPAGQPWPVIGISTAGVVNHETGLLLGATGNLPAVDSVPYHMADKLRQRLQGNDMEASPLHIHVENDANAAVYGEYVAGAAKGDKNVVMVTLGTGVGGGLIINDQLLRGSHFSGAEVGHIRISLTNDRDCTCGRLGCWESYASGTGFARTGRRELRELLHSPQAVDILQGKPVAELSTRDILAAYRRGNPLAVQLIEKWHQYVATGIGNLMNILDPDVVVIGGGMAQFIELERLTNYLYERVMEPMQATPLRIATLGNQAGLVGAAALALETVQ
jgi:glucokinase